MRTSPASSASRTATPSPLEDVSPDIFSRIVVNHIALSEGRAMTSLACVSRAFAQRMQPHRAPLRLYRTLENASEGPKATALYACMDTLYGLSQVNPARRLELFLYVSATLHKHLSGQAITPHGETLLAGLQYLERQDQPAALLGLLTTHGNALFCATKQQFVDMASRVGALAPSLAQYQLAIMLEDEMRGRNGAGFPERARAFFSLCMRLQPAHQAKAIGHALSHIGRYTAVKAYPALHGASKHDMQMKHNKHVLLWGLHGCVQSILLQELPLAEKMLLLGRALTIPVLLDDAEEGDRMAISLLQMIPPGDDDSRGEYSAGDQHCFDELAGRMLNETFERGPRHSIHRFQCLYQAMAHLPQSRQFNWMRRIVRKYGRQDEAGVTPALIVATAQAAWRLDQARRERSLLYDLFAVSLNPAPMQKSNAYPSVQPAEVDPSRHLAYTRRFDAKCRDLMQLLQEAAPDTAGQMLVGINDAYIKHDRMAESLPLPKAFQQALYGCFLKQAQAFLQGLPAENRAACLLQLRLPFLYTTDARLADDWTSSLITAVAHASRDHGQASLGEQVAVVAKLLKNGMEVRHHSPARNRRLLATLAAFPDAVAADVLARLLKNDYMPFVHTDVLFASIIEAASRLPAVSRSSVLEVAAGRLNKFPDSQDSPLSALRQSREGTLERQHPGLQASDPELYAILRPGCVSRMEGWALLLDAVETLPAQDQADRMRQLAGRIIFFDFSNGRLSQQEKAQCSLRLLSTTVGLPRDKRTAAFASWLAHVKDQSYGPEERATMGAALLALPADDGKPLLDAYLATVWSDEEKAALRQRAALRWKDAV